MIRTFVTTPFLSTTITTHTELSSNNVYIFKECLKIEINFVFCFFFSYNVYENKVMNAQIKKVLK